MLNTDPYNRITLRSAVTRACAILALGGVAAPGIAVAQATEEGASGGLEEVVVTARRRSEGLSRVPISVNALSAEQLLERSIRTDSDLQIAVPGLTIRQTQGNNSLTYSIRGQSADTFSGSPSAVIAYMNEVPLTISGASTFYDLDSIQVLKGPQGTLFGKNTTGGAVLYTSAKPTNELEGSVRVRSGNYDLLEVEGVLNVPIVDDTVLLRAAFNTLERDGYIDNILTGDELGELDRDSGRVSLTISPGERFQNDSVFAYSESGGTNTGASYTFSVYECGETNNGYALNCASSSLYGPFMDTVFGFEGAWAGYLAAHPEAYPEGLAAYVEEQKRLGYYKTQHPSSVEHDGEDWIFTNHTTFDLTDNMQIKNILGVSRAEMDTMQPQLGAPFLTIITGNVDTGRYGNEMEVESISDEIQLTGTAFEGDLDYIVGLYFQDDQADTLWPQTYFDLTPWAPPTTATNNFRITTETQAFYAQGTYNIERNTGIDLAFTAGFRWTVEDVTIEQLKQADAFGAADQDESFEEPSWELGVEWGITDELFTYVKGRSSFRSGGFNGSAPPVDAGATGGGNKFDVETVDDVEVGLKFRGVLAGMPTTFNVAAYKSWIEDVQRVEFPDPDGPGGLASIAVTANVPEMEVEGVELEASLAPTDWLELGVTGAYTDAEFTDGDVSLFGIDYTYSPVANTPEYSGSAYGKLTFMAGEAGDLSLRADLYAQSGFYFSNTADSIAPRTKLDSYELLNARLDWRGIFGTGLSAALWARNLTDEEYFVGGMALASSLGHNAAAVGEPRMYGLELAWEF
ncbi:hypothetical protein E4634_18955 [Mangrovimicrobium sediminis]|uniref:TonB-dependent receptor plug domain-containing protein n=1 Tax=Mangrovimicrobium sediminis TaxID=2562682 RepID=A0A4Z0LVK5_9GAMM|nr:TonB-dependent receptor plug domain-containing protein [Haliea sp. SAOS-164]TGD71352.1 hypothetical protein E4634_18955 [Haliea sp. SAOS-164]